MPFVNSRKSSWREKKERLGRLFLFILVYIESFWPLLLFYSFNILFHSHGKNPNEINVSDAVLSWFLVIFSFFIFSSIFFVTKLISRIEKISTKKLVKIVSSKENTDKYLEYFSIVVIPCMAFNFLDINGQISIFALIVIMGFVVVKCRIFMINIMRVGAGMRLYEVELTDENGKLKTVQIGSYKNLNDCVDERIDVFEISNSVFIVKQDIRTRKA